MKKSIALVALLGIIVIIGCVGGDSPAAATPTGAATGAGAAEIPVITSVQTFFEEEGEVCEEDGKPLVLLFSTTWCGHCKWVGPTFDKVAYEYAAAGKIAAYHYELDTGDNILTPEEEKAVPQEHIDIYKRFNPRGSIPTFVFGCEYYRIGNGYEQEKDLGKEEAEFRFIIEELLRE